MCALRHNGSGIQRAVLNADSRGHRCNVVVTYLAWRQGKKYLPGVGGQVGKPGGGALGHGGRASFTLYVLLGPSLAVAVALAGFRLTRDTGGLQRPTEPQATATASPLASPTTASATPPIVLPGRAATSPATDPRTLPPSAAPATAAPTAPPPTTLSPTAPPAPSLTPPPTSTPPLPTLPPLPTPIPTPPG